MIRPARIDDARAMAQVHVDAWRITYAGIVADAYLANLSYERSQAKWIAYLSDPRTHAFVAEAQPGQIVGLASGGPTQETLPGYDGELYVLYVLRAYQGMGYGRLLFSQVARTLASEGYRSLVAWVLKDNPACGFYERLGGLLLGEKAVEIGGKPLTDVAYGWPDLVVFE
jgi:ribosomal protein S18 acetylase RimI-like enzyme